MGMRVLGFLELSTFEGGRARLWLRLRLRLGLRLRLRPRLAGQGSRGGRARVSPIQGVDWSGRAEVAAANILPPTVAL